MYRNPNIGGAIVLGAIGLILALAVNDKRVGPLEVDTIGWILVGAALVWVLLTLVIGRPRDAALAGGGAPQRAGRP